MKLPSSKRVVAIFMLLLLIAIVPIGIVMEWDERSGVALPEWELKWGSSNIQDVEEAASAPDEDWTKQTESSSSTRSPMKG